MSGGWGIRIGRSGRAYNLKGRSGVQLCFRSGERILIGTQGPDGPHHVRAFRSTGVTGIRDANNGLETVRALRESEGASP